jgi:hypothetical protein
MSRKTLISKLKSHELDTTGTKKILSARLLKAIVVKGRKGKFDPRDMDDRQPEKWSHIANLAQKEAQGIEPRRVVLSDCFQRSKELIRYELFEIHFRQRSKVIQNGNSDFPTVQTNNSRPRP